MTDFRAATIEAAGSNVKDDERKFAQDVYIRVCRDSGFKIEMHRAMAIAAQVLETRPIDLYFRMGCSLSVLEQIAAGEHMACHR